jgi:hypothetical protein
MVQSMIRSVKSLEGFVVGVAWGIRCAVVDTNTWLSRQVLLGRDAEVTIYDHYSRKWQDKREGVVAQDA